MRIDLPADLFGGNPAGLIELFGLRVSRQDEMASSAWDATAPDDIIALTCKTLHAPGLQRDRFDVSTVPKPTVEGGISRDLLAEFHRYRTQLTDDGSLPAVIQQIIYTVMSVTDEQVPDAIRWASETLDSIALVGEAGVEQPLFPQHSVHDIRIDHRVHLWVKLPQIFMRLKHNTFAEILAESKRNPDGLVFQSSAALTEGSVFGGLYFAPLLTNLIPNVWGFGVPRIEQTIIYAFGRQVTGLNDAPAPPNLISTLQALVHTSPSTDFDATRLDEASLHKNAFAEAVEWWAERINRTIIDLYCPTTYTDSAGTYVPAVHQQWMLNFEQLLHRISAIGLSPRNHASQVAMMMTAMDILGDGFYGSGGIGTLMEPKKIAKTIAAIESRVPRRLRTLIMSPTQRALAAARQTEDGFFVPSPNPDATTDSRLRDFWTARRNTTHGFHNNADILAEHHGKLPADIVLVPMVYLLDLLTDRQHVLKRIQGAGARVGDI